MGRFSKILLLGVVFTLAFVVAQPAAAQVSSGSVSGTVVDQTGGSVPAASVVLTNRGTGAQATATTQDNGAFRFALLPVGVYDLEIMKQGFKKLKLTNIAVDANVEHALGSVKLELGAASATVEVSAAPPMIETQQAQITTSITSAQIQSFPGLSENEGLDFLALQVPGANSSRDLWFSNANGAAFGVNGMRGRNNDQQVDGQNNNDNSVAGPGLFLANVDFVSEYQITTNNFGPEYGRNSGSVVNIVTKSGTNNWHGTIAGTETNSVLTSLTTEQITFQGLKKPTRFNDEFTGASIGGPIWKDHVFVFGGFDNEIASSQGVFGSGLLTPTNSPDSTSGLPAGIATMAGCYPGSSNVALLSTIGPYGVGGGGPVAEPGSVGTVFLDNPPAPNATHIVNGVVTPTCAVAMGGVQRTLGNGFHQYDWIYRTDVVIGNADRFSGRYIYQRQNFFDVEPGGGGGAAGYVFNEPSLSQDFLLDWTHTFSGRTLNELRLSFGRLNVEFGGNNIGNTVPKAGDVGSALARISFVATNLLGFGPATNLPQQRIVNTYQIQDNFSHTIGRHQLKAGANFTYQRSPNIFLPLLNGQFIFKDWAAYANNTTAAVSIANGDPTLDFREYDTFLYAGDDWKIKDNLTLNLGLTWSYYGQPANLFNNITTKRESNPATAFWLASVPLADRTFAKIPTVKNSFGPSIGFAYSPHWGGFLTGNGKTVIRGGYRLTYDPPYYNIYLNISTSAPQVFLQSLVAAPGSPTPPMPANPTGPNVRSALATSLLTGVFDPRNFNRTIITPNFGPDRIHSWTFGIQREIAKNAVFEARYVGNRGQNLFQSINDNPKISALAANFPSLIPSGLTPCPAANAVVPNATGRVNCGFGVTRERTNTAYSDYNGLQTEFRSTNLFKQLTLRSGYTWSKTTDNASEIFGTFGAGGTTAFSQNMLDFKKGEHSLSGLDVTNNWSLSFTEELPMFRTQHGVIGHILGGWAFSGSYLLTSGQPYTPLQFFLNRATGGVANDRAFNTAFNGNSDTTRPFIGNPSAAPDKIGIFGGDVCPFFGILPGDCSAALGAPDTQLYDFAEFFNLSGNLAPVSKQAVHFIVNGGFADSVFGTPFGNAGRNSLRDAIVNTGSFSLFKYINFGERVKLRWHMTMRNVFNHPNFSSIDPFLEDAGLRDDFTGFAHPELTPSGIGLAGSGPGRQIYFGLKVIF